MINSTPIPPDSGAERRRHRRHSISLDARLRAGERDVLSCIIQDFSSRGMLVGVAAEPRIVLPDAGEQVELYFALRQGERVRARSKVVRLSREGATDLLGVRIRNCNAVVLDRLLAIAREQSLGAQPRLEPAPPGPAPAHETLLREIYDGLLERATSEGGHGAYFYALMALKGHEDVLRSQLGRVFDAEPGPPFEFGQLVRPFRAAFGELEMADTVQRTIETLLRDIATDGRSGLVAR